MKSSYIFRILAIFLAMLIFSHFAYSLPSHSSTQRDYIHYDAKNLDDLWEDYIATKNSDDLLKMIKFINNNDDFILFASYELVNRKVLNDIAQTANKKPPFTFDDIFDSIDKRYPKNKNEIKAHVVTVAAAIWSMQSNQKEHPQTNQAVKKIMQQHPELDYWKRIHKLLKN
jgi:hypothetical protein